MAMFKSKINIGGKNKTVVVLNHKEGSKKSTESKEVDRLHHIHILDRSGSMYYEIDGLIENVKQTIDAMSDNDYVSIVWFSSPGQYKTLIKGARKDESLKKILDTIKSTLGCTCFSDPMREVGEIINELEVICPNFNITLFTDGEPVVPWSIQEEENRIMAEIGKYKNRVIAINTVGYGNYYNRDLLVKIASESMYGMMIHSSKINEYMSIFSHNYERVADLVMDSVELKATGTEILYLNSSSSKMGKDYMKMSMLEKKKNQFVIIADDEFDFEYNGDKYKSVDIIDPIQDATITNLLYGYAYEAYYQGRRQVTLDILAKSLKDKYFVDHQINAFTYDEVGVYSKELRRAVFKNKYRLQDGQCPDDYVPADDALCVMDVLKVLTEGDNSYVYSSNYNRIGRKVEDTFNLFKWDDKEHTTKISELIFSEKELNVSIRSKITGTVQLNPIIAKNAGLPTEVKSFVYRNQTLVKDGNLNMETIKVIVDKDTNKKLQELSDNSKTNFYPSVDILDNGYYRVTIELNKLPVINRTYLDESGNIKNVFQSINKTTELEAKQKVVNYLIKKLKENHPDVFNDKEFINYTDEQIEVLKQHGLDKNLMYAGVNNQMAEKNEEDFYLTRELSFNLKGYASLPSVDDVVDKINNNKKLNGPAQMMDNYMNDIHYHVVTANILKPDQLKQYYETELKTIKKELLRERIRINSMKIAKVLTGDWFEGLIADDKGNYNYAEGDNTLVVKTAKVKKYL